MNTKTSLSKSILGSLVMSATAACASAQVPVDHRPTADSVVAGILAQGAVDLWARHADFQGCPQADPLGGDLLVGLDPANLTDWTIGDLAALWADELATCADPSLESWYGSAVGRVRDAVSQSSVLTALPSPLPPDLRTALLAVANDPATPEGTSAAALSRLSADLSGTARIDFFLTQAGTGAAPDDWVFYEVQALWSESGTGYVAALSQAAPALSLEVLHYASDPLLKAVQAGNLAAADPSLVGLISAVEARGDMDYLYQAFAAAQASSLLQAVDAVRANVEALVAEGDLAPQYEAGLVNVLDQAREAIVNDRPSAPRLMNAFISEVEGLVQSGHLDDMNGTQLIRDAEQVVLALG